MLPGFKSRPKNTHLVKFSVVVFIPCSVRASRRRTRRWSAVSRPRRNPKRRAERQRSKRCCGVSEPWRGYRWPVIVRVRCTSVHFRAWIFDQYMCNFNEFIFSFTLGAPACLHESERSHSATCRTGRTAQITNASPTDASSKLFHLRNYFLLCFKRQIQNNTTDIMKPGEQYLFYNHIHAWRLHYSKILKTTQTDSTK